MATSCLVQGDPHNRQANWGPRRSLEGHSGPQSFTNFLFFEGGNPWGNPWGKSLGEILHPPNIHFCSLLFWTSHPGWIKKAPSSNWILKPKGFGVKKKICETTSIHFFEFFDPSPTNGVPMKNDDLCMNPSDTNVHGSDLPANQMFNLCKKKKTL